MKAIEWSKKAKKQIQKIPANYKIAIIEAAEGLATFPNTENVKKLKNHQYDYRLRVGRYRVFFGEKDGTMQVIQIHEVKKRDERTY